MKNKGYFLPMFYRIIALFAIPVLAGLFSMNIFAEVEITSNRSVEEAYSLYDSGDYSGALEYALDMIENDVDAIHANIVAAEASLELGNVEATIGYYKKALELSPDDYDAMQGLGEVYFGVGRKAEANEVFQKAINKYPDKIEMYNYSAHVYRDDGDFDNAVIMLQKAISIDPSYSEAYLNLGTTYIMMSEYKKSVDVLQKAVELDSMSYTAYNNLSLAYYRMGEYEKALEAIENAIKLSPGDKKVLKNLTYLAEEIEKIKPDYIEYETGVKDAPVEDLELVRDERSTWNLSDHENNQVSKNIYWEDSQMPVPITTEKPSVAGNDEEENAVQEITDTDESAEEEIAIVENNDESNKPVVAEETAPAENSRETITITTIDENPEKEEIITEEPDEIVESDTEKVEPEMDVEQDVKEHEEKEVKIAVKETYGSYVPYNPPKMAELPMVEKLKLPEFEGGLEALPLPDSVQNSGIDVFDGEVASIGGYSTKELAQKRKQLPGIMYFSDGEKMLWRYQPGNSAMQKMFKGIYPSCSRGGDRLLYVTWDLHNIKLYLYDFPSSSRSIILTSDKIIKNPSFSPDGKYVAYQIMTGTYRNVLEVISLKDLSRKKFPVDAYDFEFDWRPDSNKVVAVNEKCEGADGSAELCLYEWNVENGELTKKNIDFIMDKDTVYRKSGRMKIRFLNDANSLIVYPATEGYKKFYSVDVNTGKAMENVFVGKDGSEDRIWNLSTGYKEGQYIWTSMGNIWGTTTMETPPFEILIGRFVSSSVAWCKVP